VAYGSRLWFNSGLAYDTGGHGVTTYPCMITGKHYTAAQVRYAERKQDHPTEPSWGIYELDTGLAVLVDCDFDHAQENYNNG